MLSLRCLFGIYGIACISSNIVGFVIGITSIFLTIFGIEIVLCIGDCDSDVALVGTLFPSLMLLLCCRLFTNLAVGIAFRG